MDAEWIKSPTGRRVLVHWADPRPAWLWSRDGTALVWRNQAARHFSSRVKKGELKSGPEAVPIKGQVARLIRLGSLGRSSLARVQFLAGGKPVATTCSCTPITLADGETALLLVGVDPVDADVLEAARTIAADRMTEGLLPPDSAYRLVENGGEVTGDDQLRIAAGPKGEVLVLSAGEDAATAKIDVIRRNEGLSTPEANEDVAGPPEPLLPLGLEPRSPPPETLPQAEPGEAPWVGPATPQTPEQSSLSSLFDRLAGDEDLYGPLSASDEILGAPATVRGDGAEVPAPEPTTPTAAGVSGDDMIAAVIAYADDLENPAPANGHVEPAVPLRATHWMITGRGFRTLPPDRPQGTDDPRPEHVVVAPSPDGSQPEPSSTVHQDASPPLPPVASSGPPVLDAAPETAPVSIATVEATPDADTADRATRYNFEELSRILTDRVGADLPASSPERPRQAHGPAIPGVINLNAETLVLNRLPLAILVFRDQQVLFGNRALIDMLGHDSVESLRAAGIASIFPTPETATAGPVTRLVRRDGSPLAVIARLQSVSWQGRAALMLSANASEMPRGHEAAVRAFAEIAAEAREEGFLLADRAGSITQLSGHGAVLLGRPTDDIVGKPLSRLVARADIESLRTFLEKPARFAETARPSLIASSEDGHADIALFAEGQAGVVSGYFGFVKKRSRASAPAAGTEEDVAPSMLSRLSRGIRRPLNTILGFADLIRSAAVGAVDQEKYAEYARDIRTAGLEIAVLVDELDDFTRLRDGRYAPRPSDVDLGALLDSCVVRVKGQASAARVLVRSAISEQLPRIRADRASLGQALLNLLASAIDQTPVGGSVILAAQRDDDGGIAIHIRDGAAATTDLVERFVVFRDGVDKDGEQLQPVRSSVGLALTRSLLAVNACSLSVDPTAGTGTLFTMAIPADLVERS